MTVQDATVLCFIQCLAQSYRYIQTILSVSIGVRGLDEEDLTVDFLDWEKQTKRTNNFFFFLAVSVKWACLSTFASLHTLHALSEFPTALKCSGSSQISAVFHVPFSFICLCFSHIHRNSSVWIGALGLPLSHDCKYCFNLLLNAC